MKCREVALSTVSVRGSCSSAQLVWSRQTLHSMQTFSTNLPLSYLGEHQLQASDRTVELDKLRLPLVAAMRGTAPVDMISFRAVAGQVTTGGQFQLCCLCCEAGTGL